MTDNNDDNVDVAELLRIRNELVKRHNEEIASVFEDKLIYAFKRLILDINIDIDVEYSIENMEFNQENENFINVLIMPDAKKLSDTDINTYREFLEKMYIFNFPVDLLNFGTSEDFLMYFKRLAREGMENHDYKIHPEDAIGNENNPTEQKQEEPKIKVDEEQEKNTKDKIYYSRNKTVH